MKARVQFSVSTVLSTAMAYSFSSAVMLASAPEAQAQLEEVVVTARKREESMQNIPVVMTAISGDEFSRRDMSNLESISTATPQFVVARGTTGNGANLSVRGIGSNITSIGIEQSVSVNVDGVYQGQGRVLNEAMFDVQQVEILKGPQALFFGKNATAGAVSITTADPWDTFESMGRVGYETTTEELRLEGMVSGPVTDTLALRLAVRASDMSGGIMENQAGALPMNVTDLGNGSQRVDYQVGAPDKNSPKTEQQAARLTALYRPVDNFSVKLKGFVNQSESNSGSWANELWRCESGTSQLSPGAECKGNWKNYDQGLPTELVRGNSLLSKHGGQLYEESNSNHFTSIVHYDTADISIDWVTGWQEFSTQFMIKGDATPNMNRGTFAGTDTEYSAASTELRIQSSFDSSVNFMGGMYYQASELTFRQDILFPGSQDGGPLVDSSAEDPSTRMLTVRKLGETEGTTFATFGQMMWEFMADWELTVGARYTRETKESSYGQPYVISAFRGVFRQIDPNNPLSQFNETQNWDNISPEIMLSWQATEDILVFGGFKTGYKSGGFSISGLNSSGTSVGDLAFGPEEAEGFEGGIKSTWLDGGLRLGLSAYFYEYDDLQVDFFDSTITTFVTYNAGTATTKGIELDGEWAPTFAPGLTLRGSLNYNDAYYSAFPAAPCYAGQTPAQGCQAATADTPRLHQNLKGEDTALAADWTAALGANYEWSVGDGLRLGLSTNMKYSSDYNLSPFGNPVAKQDSYVTVDAAVRIGSEDERWELALIGKNLTDEYILTYSQDAPSTGSGTGTPGGVAADQFGAPLMPMTAVLQLTVRY